MKALNFLRASVLSAVLIILPSAFVQSGAEANVITYTNLPRTLQFFARDSQDSALVTYSGSLFTSGYDSAYIEVYRNNLLWKRRSAKLTYMNGSASFNLGQKIYSELAEYKFRFFLKSGSTSTHISTADSLVCGDVFIITGQSNANPTSSSATYKNEYCRSFGVQTANYNSTTYNPADTVWGFSRADGSVYPFSGPYNVGVWGLRLQELIRNTYGKPTCIINGGRASSTIAMHLRNDANPTDLTTTYGRLLYRVKKSGLADKVKAIFWFQGESDGTTAWVNYMSNFKKLHNSWKTDFPGFSKAFLFQTRPCCSEQYASQMRDVQRRIPDELPNIELMSTAGIPHYEGCHYGYQGYLWIADMAFRPLSRYYYGGTDTVNMRPPHVKAAFFISPAKNEIAVLFSNSSPASWPADTLNQKMRDYFYLDGQTGKVQSGSVNGDTVKLKLFTSSTATKLTYLPTVWTHDDSLVYGGPFLRNPRRIGALSFHDYPISNYNTTRIVITAIQEGLYNMASGNLAMRDTMNIILRRNTAPYQAVDSCKIIIDSMNFQGTATFRNTPAGTYFIVIKGRSLIETWSKSTGVALSPGGTYSYDFTTGLAQAYGSNLILKGGKACIYSSDVNGDGIIDGMDNAEVANDAIEYQVGYRSTDINGDRLTDGQDGIIVDNHLPFYVTVRRP